jgi:hypothetical protein
VENAKAKRPAMADIVHPNETEQGLGERFPAAVKMATQRYNFHLIRNNRPRTHGPAI